MVSICLGNRSENIIPENPSGKSNLQNCIENPNPENPFGELNLRFPGLLLYLKYENQKLLKKNSCLTQGFIAKFLLVIQKFDYTEVM